MCNWLSEPYKATIWKELNLDDFIHPRYQRKQWYKLRVSDCYLALKSILSSGFQEYSEQVFYLLSLVLLQFTP